MDANDSIFYTSLYSFLGTFLLALAGLVYKCKSKNIKICGCLEIQRDVQVELKDPTNDGVMTYVIISALLAVLRHTLTVRDFFILNFFL